jgi:methylenetetrahydrofolate dehydrogenase (NADP+)/methenyltetrahydrofolate cyclohydrolase
MAEVLKGALVAEAINERAKAGLQELVKQGILPTLAIVRVGERADDLSYEKGATKRCEKVGVAVRSLVFPAEISQEELMEHIEALNHDSTVHGILLFRPLPKHMDEAAVCESVASAKDVDGITTASMAGVYQGIGQGFPPCTPQACMEVLDYYGIELTGKRAVVIGRSLVVGKPLAMMLLKRHATVTICHTRTKDMAEVCRDAQILCAAAGQAGMVDESFLSPDQILLDVGINVDEEGHLCGDVNGAQAQTIVKAYTPVPGGIGTVTTSVLVWHVIEAARASLSQKNG